MSLKESLSLRHNPNSRFEYVVAKHVPDDNPFYLIPIESSKNKVKPKKNPFKEYPPSNGEESPEEELPQSEHIKLSGFPGRQEHHFNIGFREGDPTVTELQDEIARLRDDLGMQRGNQGRLQNLELMNRGLGYELQMMKNENDELRNRIEELNYALGGPSSLPTGEYRKDERGRKLADNYERKIAELQRELDTYRFGAVEAGTNPQIQNELYELRAKNKNLEYQVQRLQVDIADADEHRAKLVRAEVDNRSLQTQVDTLKGLLKSKTDEIARIDADYRGLLNEKVDENNLFQRKIQELTSIKDNSRVLFSVEIDRLHSLVSEKMAENEALHERLDKLERFQTTEPNESERGKYESANVSRSIIEASPNKLNELERANRDLKFKVEEHQGQIEALKIELKSTIQDNVAKDSEIVRLKATVDALRSFEVQPLPIGRTDDSRQVSVIYTEAPEANRDVALFEGISAEVLRVRLIDYENKMVLFVIELERLQQEKTDLADTVEQLKDQSARREKDYNQQIKTLREYYESGKNDNLEDQLRDSTAKLSAEKHVIEYQLASLRARLEELEKRERELQDEVDKYRKESLELGSEAEAWKSKYQFLERRYQSEIDDLRGDMDYRIRETVDLEIADLNLKFSQERNTLELAVVRLKNRIQDYENRLVLFIFEIERLQIVLADRNHEISRLKEIIDGQDQTHDEALDALRLEFDKILKKKVENELDVQQGGWQGEKQIFEELLQEERFRNENLERTIQRQLDEIDRLHKDLNKYVDQLDPRDQARQQEIFYILREEVSKFQIQTVMLMIEMERLDNIVQMQSRELQDLHRNNVILAETLEQVAPSIARNLPHAISSRQEGFYSPIQIGERRALEAAQKPGDRQGVMQLDLSKLPAAEEERVTLEEDEIKFGGPERVFEGEELAGIKKPEAAVRHGREEEPDQRERAQGREPERQGPSSVPLRGSRGSRDSLRQLSQDRAARESAENAGRLFVPEEDFRHPHHKQKNEEDIVRSYILDEGHEIPNEEKTVKLLSDIAKRDQEIEELKKQIDDLQHRHHAEKEQLRDELQDAINSKSDGDLKALIEKINDQKNALEDENNQLLNNIKKLEEDVVLKAGQNEHLADDLRRLEDQNKKLLERLKEVEPLNTELEDLRNNLNQRDHAVAALEDNNKQLQLEKAALQDEINRLNNELINLKQDHSIRREHHEGEVKEKEKEKDDLAGELKRLEAALGERDQQITDFRAQNDQAVKDRDELENALLKAREDNIALGKSLKSDLQALQQELENRDQQNQRLTAQNLHLKAENDALGKGLTGDLQALQDELEKRGQEIQRLLAENSNLANALQSKNLEIQDLSEKQDRLKNLLDQKDHAFEELVANNNLLKNDNDQMHHDLTELSNAFAEKEHERAQFADENNQLKAKLNELEAELKELSIKHDGLVQEKGQNSQSLITELKDREDEIRNLQLALDQLSLEKEAEKQALKDDIDMKDKVIKDLQKEGGTLANTGVGDRAKLDNENKTLKQALTAEKAKNDDLANKLKTLNQEKEKLEKGLKDKEGEVKALGDKNKAVEQELNRLKKLNDDSSENTKRLKADLDKSRDELQKARGQATEDQEQLDEIITTLNKEKNLYQFRFTLVCAELERLTKWQKQNEESVKRLQSEADQLFKQETKKLKDQLDSLMRERENDKKLAESIRGQGKFEAEQKMRKLEQDNKNLDMKLKTADLELKRLNDLLGKNAANAQAQKPLVDYEKTKKIEEQLKTLTANLEKASGERDTLSQESNQLKDKIKQLEERLVQPQQKSEKEIEEIVNQVQQARDQELLQTLEQARTEFDLKLEEKDREIELLKNDLVALQRENKEKNDEIDYLKDQLQGIEQHFTAQIKELVNTMERAKEDEINKLLEEKQRDRLLELEHLKERMEEEVRGALGNQKAQYEKERGELVFELEAKNREIDFLKTQLGAARGTLDPKDIEVRFSAERSALETQILQLRQKVIELQKTNDELTRENNDLRNELKRRAAEAQKQKESWLAGDRSLDFEDLRRQLDQYRRLNREFEENKAKSDAEKAQIQTALQQRNQLIQQNRLEVEKLYELLEARKEENESLAHDLSESRQEATRFMRDFKDIEREYVILKHKYEQLIKELEEMIRMRDMYREQWEQSNQDLTRKNQELVLKIEEVDSLRIKYEDAILQSTPVATNQSRVEIKRPQL